MRWMRNSENSQIVSATRKRKARSQTSALQPNVSCFPHHVIPRARPAPAPDPAHPSIYTHPAALILPPYTPFPSHPIDLRIYVPPRALWGWYGGTTPALPPPPPPAPVVFTPPPPPPPPAVLVAAVECEAVRVGGSTTPAPVTMKKARLLPATCALAGGACGRASCGSRVYGGGVVDATTRADGVEA